MCEVGFSTKNKVIPSLEQKIEKLLSGIELKDGVMVRNQEQIEETVVI